MLPSATIAPPGHWTPSSPCAGAVSRPEPDCEHLQGWVPSFTPESPVPLTAAAMYVGGLIAYVQWSRGRCGFRESSERRDIASLLEVKCGKACGIPLINPKLGRRLLYLDSVHFQKSPRLICKVPHMIGGRLCACVLCGGLFSSRLSHVNKFLPFRCRAHPSLLANDCVSSAAGVPPGLGRPGTTAK